MRIVNGLTADQKPSGNHEQSREGQTVAHQKPGKARHLSMSRGLESRQGGKKGCGQECAEQAS